MLRITNTQPGPRGVNAVAGPMLIEPGEAVTIEVYARERQHIEATGWFAIKGDYTPNPDAGEAAAVSVGLDDAAKASIDSLSEEVTSLRNRIGEMQDEAAQKALAEKDKRIAELEAQVAAANKSDGGKGGK